MRDIDKGWFGVTQARRTGVVVSFADICYLRPNTITVTDPAGSPVDPYDLSNYTLVNADEHPRDSYDDKRSAFANLRRDFAVRGVPVTLKGGLEVNSNNRNLRGTTTPFNFVGRDGIASNIALGPGTRAHLDGRSLHVESVNVWSPVPSTVTRAFSRYSPLRLFRMRPSMVPLRVWATAGLSVARSRVTVAVSQRHVWERITVVFMWSGGGDNNKRDCSDDKAAASAEWSQRGTAIAERC